MKDYYEILQVRGNAIPEVIAAAYRRLAQIYHPDVNKAPNADHVMKDINEAYEILSDPVKRAEYDLKLRRARVDQPHSRTTDQGASSENPKSPRYPADIASSFPEYANVVRSLYVIFVIVALLISYLLLRRYHISIGGLSYGFGALVVLGWSWVRRTTKNVTAAEAQIPWNIEDVDLLLGEAVVHIIPSVSSSERFLGIPTWSSGVIIITDRRLFYSPYVINMFGNKKVSSISAIVSVKQEPINNPITRLLSPNTTRIAVSTNDSQIIFQGKNLSALLALK